MSLYALSLQALAIDKLVVLYSHRRDHVRSDFFNDYKTQLCQTLPQTSIVAPFDRFSVKLRHTFDIFGYFLASIYPDMVLIFQQTF